MSNDLKSSKPAISLPKGGGSIKGIGEKFQPNLFTGTGNFSVPIALSPGRNKFGPKLSLEYSTGNGNGPFGLGWQLSIPRITRKTEKGLPTYTEKDIFVISGAEDLVPYLEGGTILPIIRQLGDHTITRFRPRTEGSFSRIEKWVHIGGDTHWRITTKENITSVYGKTSDARILDLNNSNHVFEWLLEETFDAKGNHIFYEYTKENPELKISKIYEKNRKYNQTYIRRILYGNTPDNLDNYKKVGPEKTGTHHQNPNETKTRHYLFEVLFDYGDLAKLPDIPFDPERFPDKTTTDNWPVREDPFSGFRAGFEVRTLRLCQRFLMMHYFKESELETAPLVKSTDFQYENNNDLHLSMLVAIKVTGYRKEGNTYRSSEMPPVSFKYSEFNPQERKSQSILAKTDDLPPYAFSNPDFSFFDLYGDALPDLLQTNDQNYYYWRNLGQGKIDCRQSQQFSPAEIVLSDPNVAIGDMGGDGQADLVIETPQMAGFYEATPAGSWKPFRLFESTPTLNLRDPNTRLVDLTGDGLSDILITGDDHFFWFKCLGERGYDNIRIVKRIYNQNEFPDLSFNDQQGRVRLADMSGDGLNDIVLITDGRIDYWPNLGYGRFGKRITMKDSPHFSDEFDAKRLFLVDIEGSGLTDLVYVGFDQVTFWFNRSGNSWSQQQIIENTPIVTDINSVRIVDLYGSGTSTLVWSYDHNFKLGNNYKVLDFCDGKKPFLLIEMSNNMGATTKVQYTSSTKFYLEDKENGKPWITNLPFPVQVLEKSEVIDHISKTKLVTTYKYHHGYFDGREREFRGFGRVDQYDTEEFKTFANFSLHEGEDLFTNNQEAYHVPPVLTKSWFHTGIYFDENIVSLNGDIYDRRDMMEAYRKEGEFYQGDSLAFRPKNHDVDKEEVPHEAYRALRGSLIRKEVYALDGTDKEDHPYLVTENNYHVKQLQPKNDNYHGVFLTTLKENTNYHYERNPDDPRVTQQLTLAIDDYGNITDLVTIAYPRRPSFNRQISDEQRDVKGTYKYTQYINEDTQENLYYIGLPCEIKTFEIYGLDWRWPTSSSNGVDPIQDSLLSTIMGSEGFEPYNYLSPENLTELKKRIIDWTRTYFRKKGNPALIDQIGNIPHRLPLGVIDSLGLPFENYQVAFTNQMLTKIYGDYASTIKPAQDGGYHPHPNHPNAEKNASGYWWIPSGRQSFDDQKFFQIIESQDQFNEKTINSYDDYGLLVTSVEDALSFKYSLDNKLRVENNYRVLQPKKVIDPNGNITEAKFDSLGMVVGSVVRGEDENGNAIGDSFTDFVEDLNNNEIKNLIDDPLSNPNNILKNATTRVVYDLNRYFREDLPNVVYTIARETHASEQGGDTTKLQHEFLYSDGFGRVVQSKSRAEPGDINGTFSDNRWVGTGTKVYNNKGKQVQEFEPFFSANHDFGIEQHGVSPILFYDPLERLVCTVYPNHTYEKVVFDSWKQEMWDPNDTIHPKFRFNPQEPDILPDHTFDPVADTHVGYYFQGLKKEDYLPTWYDLRMNSAKTLLQWPNYDEEGNPIPWNSKLRNAEKKTAVKVAKHSATPSIFHLDVIGRIFLKIADNGKDHEGNDIYLETHFELDIEGNDTVTTDPRGTEAFVHTFDIAGRKLRNESVDAGTRLAFPNTVNNPIFEWDTIGHMIQTEYDELQRPIKVWVSIEGRRILAEKTIFGDQVSNASKYNLITHVYKQYDEAGLVTYECYDFKGNLKQKKRRVIKNSEIMNSFGTGGEPSFFLDWETQNDSILDTVEYTTEQKHDALNRVFELKYPDNTLVNIKFNEANLLDNLKVDGSPYIKNIDYNEKGQRELILYGNNIQTKYDYDTETFRLKRLWTQKDQGTGSFLQNLNYYYDPVGNIVAIDDEAKNGNIHPILPNLMQHTREYTYDSIYRLISAQGKECIDAPNPLNIDARIPVCIDQTATRSYMRKYSYDHVGNIISISHKAPIQGAVISNWNENFVYGTATNPDGNNRLREINVSSGSRTVSFDLNGNMKKIGNRYFYWNYADRMRAATISTASDSCNTSMQALYLYDANGMRVMKVVKCGSILKITVYIDGIYEIYQELTKTNSSLSDAKEHKTYKHIMDETTRIAIIKAIIVQTKPDNEPLILYHQEDHLGSSQIVTTENGNLYSQEEYYPYGETSFGSYAKKRYRYNGKERDEETGFYYYGARYYIPWVGRWVSLDPIILDLDIKQEKDNLDYLVYQMNGYCAFRNNPIKLIDPTGKQVEQIVDQVKSPQTSEKATKQSENIGSEEKIVWVLFGEVNETEDDAAKMKERYEAFRDDIANKGYQLKIEENVTKQRFLEIVKDPRSIAIALNAHAREGNIWGKPTVLESQDWSDPDKIQPKDIKEPSNSLEFVGLIGCQTGQKKAAWISAFGLDEKFGSEAEKRFVSYKDTITWGVDVINNIEIKGRGRIFTQRKRFIKQIDPHTFQYWVENLPEVAKERGVFETIIKTIGKGVLKLF